MPSTILYLFNSVMSKNVYWTCVFTFSARVLGGRAGIYKYKPTHHRQRTFNEFLSTAPLKLPTAISLLSFFGSQDPCYPERERNGRCTESKREKIGEKLESSNVLYRIRNTASSTNILVCLSLLLTLHPKQVSPSCRYGGCN